jgi:hypothetical protein
VFNPQIKKRKKLKGFISASKRFFLVVLGFELKALHLVARHSTA